MRNRIVFSAIFVVLVGVDIARADGVIEINQACVPVGCFAGDDPGFPVEINDSGSYRLTSNLVVSDGSDGIFVENGRPTIDFNGFELRGPVTCFASLTTDDPALLDSVNCSGSGGLGIGAFAGRGYQVRNGTVAGFDNGLNTPTGSVVENMTVRENSNNGINALRETVRIHKTTISTNGNDGIAGGAVETRLLVTESIIRANNETGIYLANGIVRNSLFTLNGDDAVRSRVTGAGGLVADCHFSQNIEAIDGFSKLGVRDSVFLGNSSDVSGATSLGGNLCDGVSC